MATGEGPWSLALGGTRAAHLLPSGSRGRVWQFRSVPCCCWGLPRRPGGSAEAGVRRGPKPCHVCKHLSSTVGICHEHPMEGTGGTGRGHRWFGFCALLKRSTWSHVASWNLPDLCLLCVLSFHGCLFMASNQVLCFHLGALLRPNSIGALRDGWILEVRDSELWHCCFTLQLLLPALDPGAVSLPDFRGRETKIPILHDLPKFTFH